MAIIPALQFLEPIIQDDTLRREFLDALFPGTLFRGEATRELWEANVGDTQIFTKGSLLPVAVVPLTPGVDPVPTSEKFEQWSVTACQYGLPIMTNMQVSRAALASKFTRDAHTLGLNAGQTMNQLVRNKLFGAYLAGSTIADAAGVATVTMEVGSINGFQTVLTSDGKEVAVSPSNQLFVSIAGATAVPINAAVASDGAFPRGAGTLTFAAVQTWSAGDRVVSVNATVQQYSGGAANVDTDDLAAGDILTLEDIRIAVSTLQANSIPPHPDGRYHVHIDPIAVSQIYGDNEFQRINETLVAAEPYRDFAIKSLLGTTLYRNNEAPSTDTVRASSQQESRPVDATAARYSEDIGGDVINKGGEKIIRTIITGADPIIEKYVPEVDFISQAGVQGKVGSFSVTTNGMYVDVEGVRYILRSPQDLLQQIVAQTWSFTGDWGLQSDQFGGRGDARFKRAIVINSAAA